MAQLSGACASDRLVNFRDRALLLLAFASADRRRPNVTGLRVEDLEDEDPVLADPQNPDSPSLPCISIHLGRTKTTTIDDEVSVTLII